MLHRRRSWVSGRLPKKKRAHLVLVLVFIVITCVFLSSHKTQTNECWLKDAFNRSDFVIFSHRSFVSGIDESNISCKDAISQLKAIGVSHMDLDLVFDEATETLTVSHPMEFKKESNFYSPCSLLPLEEVIDLLYDVYQDNSWFISLELKASWGRTQKEQNDAALTEPLQIMTALNDVLLHYNLVKTQCAVIVDASAVRGSQESEAFRKLLDHCQLFSGKRQSDIVEDTMDVSGFHYDKIMPTIEFHPMHHSNEGHFVPKNIDKHSIYWVVDTVEDLRLAADLHPAGIVSNTPYEMVSTIMDATWCKS